jgi:hypothetical protein
LPDIEFGTFKLKSNLEQVIDFTVDEFQFKKQSQAMLKKLDTAIIIGTSIDRATQSFSFGKTKLSTLSKADLERLIAHAKTNLQAGEKILNTNLEQLGITL